MASDKVVERRRVFHQYRRTSSRGKPFYLYAMFHDTVSALVVVMVIIRAGDRLAVHDPGNHSPPQAGWLGKPYDAPADPGTINSSRA